MAGGVKRQLIGVTQRAIKSRGPQNRSEARSLGWSLYGTVNSLIPRQGREVNVGAIKEVCQSIRDPEGEVDVGGFAREDVASMVEISTEYLKRIQKLGEKGAFLFSKIQASIEEGIELVAGSLDR